jgi:hypothetical protein
MVQVLECLPGKSKALSAVPSTTKKGEREREREGGNGREEKEENSYLCLHIPEFSICFPAILSRIQVIH